MELQLITSYTLSFQDLIFRIVEKQQRSKLQKTTTATRLIKELFLVVLSSLPFQVDIHTFLVFFKTMFDNVRLVVKGK